MKAVSQTKLSSIFSREAVTEMKEAAEA